MVPYPKLVSFVSTIPGSEPFIEAANGWARAWRRATHQTARRPAGSANPRRHPTMLGAVAANAEDPYTVQVPTEELRRLAIAFDVVDRHAELNHRYRKLVEDSRDVLTAEQIRLTQARGLAKRLMVLTKAAGPELRGQVTDPERDALDDGLRQADELVFGR